ncbi:hypothetical protein AMEX_G3067 [Astyanax mexicanus]|uniref:Apoptosis facilitator Bcl-2-like protein 14 n=1 Tax=Astyanax mexicanus TaxID=7994 RepID=A0A8T2MEW5_ASTMX|nr:hypothetical protein AMEX_G3067 [Astyanax mexicanus]
MADLRVDIQTVQEANGHTQTVTEDSFEYRLLQTYTKKKGPTYTPLLQSNGTTENKPASPVPSAECNKAKKKRRKIIAFNKLLACIRPQKEHSIPVSSNISRSRASSFEAGPDTEVDDIVNKLTKISDSVHFQPSDLETDSDDVVDKIVEILREHGDKLDEEIKNNRELMQQLQGILSYSFFKKLTRFFIQRVTPEEAPPVKHPKEAHIALICELTSRLTVMDRHPMNRVLGFGAKYLQENYTAWVNQQGGYGKVFSSDDEKEDE